MTIEEKKEGEEEIIETEGNEGDGEGEGSPKEKKDGEGEKKPETESPEAKKSRLERQLEQHKKKHPELYNKDGERKDGDKKSDSLDYSHKAFLAANGIKGADEQKLAQKFMRETGKTLDEVIDSKYFQAELSELREINKTSDAGPQGKRGGGPAIDSVEYWMQKGELPPASNVELRRKVVDARIKKDQSGGQFYNSGK